MATRSTRAGATSSPSAEATPAEGGQIDAGRPSLRATAVGVHRPGAAGAEERVVARVAAALGDVHARRARHALVHHVVDAPRHLGGRQAQPRGHALQRGPRRGHVDRASRRPRSSRDRGSRAGSRRRSRWARCRPARRRRARLRAGAARPHLEEADLVDVAMLPPPAPISISSMVEMRMGSPLPSTKRFCRAASKLVGDRAARRRPPARAWRWCPPCRRRAGCRPRPRGRRRRRRARPPPAPTPACAPARARPRPRG